MIESNIATNEATPTEVKFNSNSRINITDETTLLANSSINEGILPSNSTNFTAASSTLEFTAESVLGTEDPNFDINVINELQLKSEKINALEQQLNNLREERAQLLATSAACNSIKQETSRLLNKLVPYTNRLSSFSQLLQNNLNNIEVTGKVDSDYFMILMNFIKNFEPNEEDTFKIINNLEDTIACTTGYPQLTMLAGFNMAVKNSARLTSEVPECNKAITCMTKQTPRPTYTAS